MIQGKVKMLRIVENILVKNIFVRKYFSDPFEELITGGGGVN